MACAEFPRRFRSRLLEENLVAGHPRKPRIAGDRHHDADGGEPRPGEREHAADQARHFDRTDGKPLLADHRPDAVEHRPCPSVVGGDVADDRAGSSALAVSSSRRRISAASMLFRIAPGAGRARGPGRQRVARASRSAPRASDHAARPRSARLGDGAVIA